MVSCPKISVITICYNAERFIEETIESVINQTYPNLEYIIVDGASKDNTISLINKYKSKISLVISEPDGGIYYAMNKGVDLCKGDFCIFMNAGDRFYCKESVENVVKQIDIQADVVYGDTQYIYDSCTMVRSPKPLSYVMKGAFCCHQSAFFKLTLFNSYKFDIKYRIIADWALFKKLYENNHRFQYVASIVSSFDNRDGASSSSSMKNYIRHYKEKLICLGKYMK